MREFSSIEQNPIETQESESFRDLKKMIDTAAVSMETERQAVDGKNTWIPRFASVLSRLTVTVGSARFMGGDFSDEELDSVEKKLEKLQEKFFELQPQYDGVAEPPQKIQEELMGDLKSLVE